MPIPKPLISLWFLNQRALLCFCFLFTVSIALISESQFPDVFGQKAVVLTFDDGWKDQMTNAVPIMNRHDFKATFFIVCNYLDKEGRMTWDDISTLDKLGYDIQSHTMNHRDLAKLSTKDLEYEIGQSKKCLLDHGINSTIFATPFNSGWDNATVVNMTSKYYDTARSGNGEPMFLSCDKWTEDQKDCRTYYDNGTLTFANRYTIKGWSHNFYDKKYAHDTTKILDEFVNVVERQTRYNTNQSLEAIPVLIYHKIDNATKDSGTTTTELFEKEMQYLHDNGFKVLTMADLQYDEGANRFYVPIISNAANRSSELLPP
ncbi:MAG: polysaccharide deacetylase family protein [Nitrososphaeraceae archaeon]